MSLKSFTNAWQKLATAVLNGSLVSKLANGLCVSGCSGRKYVFGGLHRADRRLAAGGLRVAVGGGRTPPGRAAKGTAPGG